MRDQGCASLLFFGEKLLLPPFLYPIFLLSNQQPTHAWKHLCCKQVTKGSRGETEARRMRFLKATGKALQQEQGKPPRPSSVFFQQDSAQLSLVMGVFK